MKRLLSFMLALVLILSLGITAFADETAPKGSITITNATKGKNYQLYKVFNSTPSVDENGNPKLDANGKPISSYTITSADKFYDMMFGNNIQTHAEYGTASDYFNYDYDTHYVTEKQGIDSSKLFKYLGWLAEKLEPDATQTANGTTVEFKPLDTGYYLINRGNSSTVTVTTTALNPKVIDKNQKPNVNNSFNKLVWDEDYIDPETGEVTGAWVESSSANIGDIIKWRIPFTATNYDGEFQVQYYSIRDRKSSSLWIEFNDIEVKVNGESLGKGYYWCAGDNSLNTGDWTATNAPDQWTDDPNEAGWFLIHYGYDDIEILIPWMDNFTFEGVKSQSQGYKLSVVLESNDENVPLSKSINTEAINEVVVSYNASVGPDAANSNATNEAELHWHTVNGTTGPEDSEVTTVRTYKLGVTKVADDGSTGTAATRLSGAIFKLYKSYNRDTKEYSDPIYVIPTGQTGVYILDDVDTVVSGSNRTTSRKAYDTTVWKEWVEEGTMTVTVDGVEVKVRNDMETPANGQLVIMGLEAGTYYLEEYQPPKGYNKLNYAVEVTVGSGDTATYDNGHVVFSKIVENKRGVELPSTGGMGTMMMITIGTVIAMAFAVLMITQKKMSIYRD